MDVAHIEAVEAELTAFIERRASKEPDPDTSQASYMESVRRYHDRERQAHLWQRLRFHERMLRSHRESFREIVRRHKAGLAECEAALGRCGEWSW